MADAQTTLRDTLAANLSASEEGTLSAAPNAPAIQEETTQAAQPSGETAAQAAERARDEKGRFAAKGDPSPQAQAEPQAAPDTAQAAQAAPEPTAAPVQTPAVPRPTTWKKEYLPIFDKLVSGGTDGVVSLSADEARRLAEYSGQREKEYATGVSTYKAEAQNARELQAALDPFMGELQQANIKPAQWIANLGSAHQTLVRGTPEQKLQMFAKLAQDYGVPLAAVSQAQAGQIDPIVPQLMQHIQDLSQKVNTVTGWREQQEQQSAAQQQEAARQQIAKFEDAEKYPHFETVRDTMARLLEAGISTDLDEAYAKAVRMDDGAWSAEQERQAQANAAKQQAADKAAAAARAKQAAVSTKTTTPSGAVTAQAAKDLRSQLAAHLDALESGRV